MFEQFRWNKKKLAFCRFLVGALAAAVIAAFSPARVSAHANMVSSQPENDQVLQASPDQVSILFSEELDSESSVLVMDSGGNQVDLGDGGVDLNDLDHLSMIVHLPDLSEGEYTVRWVATSADDGDTTNGGFIFYVGEEPGAVDGQSSGTNLLWWIALGAAAVIAGSLAWRFRGKAKKDSYKELFIRQEILGC